MRRLQYLCCTVIAIAGTVNSAVLENGTNETLFSNVSASLLFTSIQSSSAVPTITVIYSTTSVLSTSQVVDTNSPSPQTITSRPFWEDLYAEDMNPYSSPFNPWGNTNPTDSAGLALQATCGQMWTASFLDWITTELANGVFTWWDDVNCYGSTSDPSDCATVEEVGTMPPFPFTAFPPCCSTCTFTAGDVQVYHWPVSTAAPSVSRLVNSDGFTFTYPSVYVAFQTLLATDLCGVVGTAINSVTTIGFDVNELSTAASYYIDSYIGDPGELLTTQSWYTYSVMDWQNSMECTDIVTSFWMFAFEDDVATTSSYFVYLQTDQSLIGTEWSYTTYNSTLPYTPFAVTYNPCTPYLSVPTRVLTLDPRWNTCIRNFKGLHDPPTTLAPGNGFLALTDPASAPASPTKTKGASAVPALQLPTATKTPAPETKPTPSSGDTPLPEQLSQHISRLPAVVTIGTTVITANSASALVIGTQTLALGREITDSGTVLSMATDGRALIIGGTSTQFLDPSYVIGSQILKAGGLPITASGTVMSLEPGGESVVIGGSVTEDMSLLLGKGTSGTATTTGLGGIIASVGGFGAGKGTSSSLDPQNTDSSSFNGTVFISGSGKRDGSYYWIAWQVVLSAVIGVSAFV